MIMSSRRSTISLMVASVLYPILVYVLVYIPFLVPRLQRWSAIPYWYEVILALPYLAIILLLGGTLSYRWMLRWAGILAFVVVSMTQVLYRLSAPGFVKAEYCDSVLDTSVLFFVYFLIVTVILLLGRLAVYMRSDNKRIR